MPTIDEQRELLDECSREWTELDGVPGYTVTGPNGNSIFLPAAGYRYGTEVYDRGCNGEYWSPSLFSYRSDFAFSLGFFSGSYVWGGNVRCYGRSVRPVSE